MRLKHFKEMDMSAKRGFIRRTNSSKLALKQSIFRRKNFSCKSRHFFVIKSN